MKTFAMPNTKTPLSHLWGGGHSPYTDPSRAGWRRVMVGDTTLVYNDQDDWLGCASLVFEEGDDYAPACWHVSLYHSTKDDIVSYLKGDTLRDRKGRVIDPRHFTVRDYPGFGLEVIELIEDPLL